MKIQVLVRLKNGVLDPQGKAVEKSALKMGFEGFKNFRIGKIIEFESNLPKNKAIEEAKKLADKLLSNPVIESYEVKVEE
ncbi:phosphoribosylformylglycinamidine synthase subunit PurS [Thermotomaculum hydrothermale]|uniref:Phosphoribosylformylglycinamidine synthase subunit PurS n=1 Tax=Thermotomaculum hydrothermale TaxID=981385 RepID=A0A7R6PWL5_9BACT|nr:phosphoribosylformylglycinamidine synthase subunit PurS [Thermotomaculum hydrothermale]BBB31970.1 phosphoribosylformylglycinamidine synthase subunit PurS [Thermotomaculum hydrothermale]